MAASERRGRSVVVGRVETWASAKVRSRPGMQPGEQESAKCGGESRPGCNEPNKCENLLETWMQRAKQVRKSARDLDAKSKRVRKSARDLDAKSQASAKICSRPVRRDLDGIECEGPLRRFTLAHAKKT
jgi:hypothetical protein